VIAGFYYNIFSDHLLPKQHLTPLARVDQEQIWPSVFFMICLALLALVKFSSFSKVIKVIQSTFSLQALHQLEREELNPLKFYALGLNLFFVLNLSFLLYKVNSIYKFILVKSYSFNQFLFFFGCILLVVALKAAANLLLGYFTNEKKLLSEYGINSLFINQTFGLLLFPWIILMELSPFNPLVFVSAAFIVLASSVLLKWYRGVIMGLVEERLGLLQIFSYFCSLEILPVFVLVKYIIETF
jgi:hypothetical protein